mgnify:CR=1 FL=1
MMFCSSTVGVVVKWQGYPTTGHCVRMDALGRECQQGGLLIGKNKHSKAFEKEPYCAVA